MTAGRHWFSIRYIMDRDFETSCFNLPPWTWAALALAIAVVFWGYGQTELLLEVTNLRYCG